MAAPRGQQALADWLVAAPPRPGTRGWVLLGEPLWLLPAGGQAGGDHRALAGLALQPAWTSNHLHQLSADRLTEIDAEAEWLATVRAAPEGDLAGGGGPSILLLLMPGLAPGWARGSSRRWPR